MDLALIVSRVVSGVLALGVGAAACAASLDDMSVSKVKKRYKVQSVVTVDAPIQEVYEVLADYDQFERVSSIFTDSRYLERDEQGNGIVFTEVRDCILFFCKSIGRTETIVVTPPLSIVTHVIPEKSDVLHGLSRWTLAEAEESTRVTFYMEMEPDFWVPPVVGPYFIRRFLRGGSADAAERVETYALELVAERS